LGKSETARKVKRKKREKRLYWKGKKGGGTREIDREREREKARGLVAMGLVGYRWAWGKRGSAR
jgi:hypothetical protein